METRNWRNSPEVTKYFQIPFIDEITHKNWLLSLRNKNPKNIAFIISNNKRYVGVTYFHSINYENKSADWGIYIHDLNMRKKGIGTKTLIQMIQYAKNELKLNKLYLDVLDTNQIAVNLYVQHGFRLLSKNGRFSRYYLDIA